MIQDIDERLEKRLGHLHARLRLGIEADHEAQVFGQGINYFHIENLPPSHIAIRSCLKLTGLYGRGRKNAARIELRSHDVISSLIPKAFDGFVILQLSDLRVEMSEAAMTRLAAMLPDIDYDLCVLTGDYRAQTSVLTGLHSKVWPTFAQHSKDRSTACWAITTQFEWCPAWRTWASKCC